MGNTFSNISVLKNGMETALIEKSIVQYMKKNGFIPASGDSSELRTIILRNNPQSEWYTVFDDSSDYQQQDELALSLSCKLETYVLFIVNTDSNIMVLHLNGHKKDDTVAIGPAFGDACSQINRKPDLQVWGDITDCTSALSDIFGKNYLASEDALEYLAPHLRLCAEDIACPVVDAPEDFFEQRVLLFASEDNSNAFIQNGETVLECLSSDEPLADTINIEKFLNRGGISRGVQVVIIGSFLDSDNVTIDEIQIERAINPRKDFYPASNIWAEKQAVMKKRREDNGQPYLICQFPDFKFPEGVNKNCSHLKGNKLQFAEFSHCIVVRFTPKCITYQRIKDMQVIMQPLQNIRGSAVTAYWPDIVMD